MTDRVYVSDFEHRSRLEDACDAHLADLQKHHPGGWPRLLIPRENPPLISSPRIVPRSYIGSPADLCAQ